LKLFALINADIVRPVHVRTQLNYTRHHWQLAECLLITSYSPSAPKQRKINEEKQNKLSLP